MKAADTTKAAADAVTTAPDATKAPDAVTKSEACSQTCEKICADSKAALASMRAEMQAKMQAAADACPTTCPQTLPQTLTSLGCDHRDRRAAHCMALGKPVDQEKDVAATDASIDAVVKAESAEAAEVDAASKEADANCPAAWRCRHRAGLLAQFCCPESCPVYHTTAMGRR